MRRTIEVEGFTPEELLALPADAISSFVFTDEPVTFRVGTCRDPWSLSYHRQPPCCGVSARRRRRRRVLVTIAALCTRYAHKRELAEIEWIVHAVHCARPNLALRRVPDNRGFQVRHISGIGPAYHRVDPC